MDKDYSKMTSEEALRSIAAAVNRAAPEQLLWATFPEDGGLEPMTAGTHTFDLKTGKVQSPDKTRVLSSEASILQRSQSAFIFVDSPVFVKIEPGVGRFALDVNAPVFSAGRQIERVEMVSSVPFMMVAVFGTHITPPYIPFFALGQARLTDTTLTKAAGAGTNDGFRSLLFVPQFGSKVLDQATYGKPTLLTTTVGQKMFIVRNLSASSVDIRIQGTIYTTVALALEALGLTGYINDKDIHTGADVASFSVTLLTNVIKETSAQYGSMRVQARIASAATPGTTARVIVEYAGMVFGIR